MNEVDISVISLDSRRLRRSTSTSGRTTLDCLGRWSQNRAGSPLQEIPTTSSHLSPGVTLGPGTYWVTVEGVIAGSNWYWEGRNATFPGTQPVPGATRGTATGPAARTGPHWVLALGSPGPIKCSESSARRPGLRRRRLRLRRRASTRSRPRPASRSSPGVDDTGNHCDDCTTPITLPFPVSVYGQVVHAGLVDSNGTLQFSGDNTTFTNTCLPTASRWAHLLPVLGRPADRHSAAPVRASSRRRPAQLRTRSFYIEWRAQLLRPGGGRRNFEVDPQRERPGAETIYGHRTTADNGASTEGGQDPGTGPRRPVRLQRGGAHARHAGHLHADRQPAAAATPTTTPTTASASATTTPPLRRESCTTSTTTLASCPSTRRTSSRTNDPSMTSWPTTSSSPVEPPGTSTVSTCRASTSTAPDRPTRSMSASTRIAAATCRTRCSPSARTRATRAAPASSSPLARRSFSVRGTYWVSVQANQNFTPARPVGLD